MDTTSSILVSKQPSPTAERFKAADSFHHSRLETLRWEVEELHKCEIKTEDLEDGIFQTDCGDIFEAPNTDKKMSTSGVDEQNLQFITNKIKTEIPDDDKQPGHNYINPHLQIRKKQLATVKCPGCTRIFWKNYCGLMDMSHHFMSSHRRNMRNYMYCTRMKYGYPQRSSYTLRTRIKQKQK